MTVEAIKPHTLQSTPVSAASGGSPEFVQPALFVIDGEKTIEKPASLQALDRFFDARDFAERNPGVRDERLDAIRDDVRKWFNETFPDLAAGKPGTPEEYAYTAPSAEASMTGRLINYLSLNHMNDGVSWAEIVASSHFLNANFAVNEDAKNGVDLSMGRDTASFIVPVRLGSEHEEYSKEIRPLVHAFHYVPDDLVPHFMRDLPTFIADRYANGGQVIVAAVTDNMRADLLGAEDARTKAAFFEIARRKVNNAVNVGVALGSTDFGYGATFPGLMQYGRHTENKEVTTTTGHGGTTAIMSMLIDKVVARIPEERRKHLRIGMLGLGKIGLPAAQVIAELHPDLAINVYDPIESNMAQVTANQGVDGRFAAQENAAELIRKSDIVLSTATANFSFTDPTSKDYLNFETLEGKWFIDDSEPHSLKPEEVMALGGIAIEVVGRDYSGRTMRRTTDFAYGHTLVDPERDGFGCELENAALHRLRKELEAAGRSAEEVSAEIDKYAVRKAVTAEQTRLWIELFKRYDIGPSRFQAFGKYALAA